MTIETLTKSIMEYELPKKLQKEPLIDAVFEIRFVESISAENVIPGILFTNLSGEKTIQRLPASELPKPIRDGDQNLKFAPLVKIDWGQYSISVGDKVLSIGCKLPYPGWRAFKSTILEVIGHVKIINIIQKIDRYSMKYVDLIEASSIEEQLSKVSLSINLANRPIDKERISLQIEVNDNDMIHLIDITTAAITQFQDGSKKQGLIVSVDTIQLTDDPTFEGGYNKLTESLDNMHQVNKKMFFDCLKPETIKSLEPEYG
jgi:uncharacterized protein (TIGR04255 family)